MRKTDLSQLMYLLDISCEDVGRLLNRSTTTVYSWQSRGCPDWVIPCLKYHMQEKHNEQLRPPLGSQ